MRHVRGLSWAAGLVAVFAPAAGAADGAWGVNASGSWSSTGSWLDGQLPTAGATAYFTNSISAARTVTVDATPSLNKLVFGRDVTETGLGWNLNGGTLTLSGATPTITVEKSISSNWVTINSILDGTAGLTKTGAGYLILTGANTFSGGVTLSAGRLQIKDATLTGSDAVVGVVNNGLGANLVTLNSGTLYLKDDGDGGTTAQIIRYTNNVQAVSGNVTIDVNTANSGTAKNKALSLGNLTIGTATTNQFTVAGQSATKGYSLRMDDVTLAGHAKINPSTSPISVGAVTVGDAVAASTTTALILDGAYANSASTVRGTISDNATDPSRVLSLTKSNSGTWVLQGANTFSGETVISGGALKLEHALALQNSTLNYDNKGGTLSFGALTAATIGGLKGAQDLPASSLSALTLNPGAGTATYGGNLGDGAGALALIKTGAGTQELSAVSAYGGATTVRDGTLRFAADKTGAGVVTVESAGTLDVGTGVTVAGDTTIKAGGVLSGSGGITGVTTIQSGGLHSPGHSPGLQTFTAGLSYESGATLRWELVDNTADGRGTQYDGIDVTGGDLTIADDATIDLVFNPASGSTVNWSDAFWDESRSWLVIDWSSTSGTSTGTFAMESGFTDGGGQALSAVRPDAHFEVARGGGGGNDLYVSYVVPEPATAGVLLLGLAGLALRRRALRA